MTEKCIKMEEAFSEAKCIFALLADSCPCQPKKTYFPTTHLTLRPCAYPLFEASTRVLVKVLARVNAVVHVLDEVVGGLDAARRVADAAAAECRGGPRVPPEIATHI